MTGRYPLTCTNDCGIEVTYDPGASGNRCPKCHNGALVPADSEMAP